MWKVRVLGTLLGLVLRLWRWTVRLEVRGFEQLEEFDVVPLAVWHGRIQGCLYAMVGRPVAAMFSNSPDGELAARALAVFGVGAVRGSTGKGGREALAAMISQAKESGLRYPALTVDGPKGPFRKSKPGIVQLAMDLGRPVLPISFSASRTWVLRSWDRTVLAKPFSRIVVELGQPVEIDPDEPVHEARERVDRALDDLTERLDREVRGAPVW